MAIVVSHVSKAFGGQPVLEDVSFSFPEKAVTAVTGRSGSGKTTLLMILLGLVEPDAGEVSGVKDRRVGVVFQEDRLIEHMSALANVELVMESQLGRMRAREILRAVGLDPEDKKKVIAYSGGMRRRVAIARALAIEPEILFLDEPFKGLDEETRRMTIEAISRYAKEATILLISHDAEDAALMGAGVKELTV